MQSRTCDLRTVEKVHQPFKLESGVRIPEVVLWVGMLNLHSFFHGHETCEFRLWQFDNPDGERKGGLHAGQLKAYIYLALAMNAACKMMKGCRSGKGQRENEKFAMRTWLMRLGFIGDEYKTLMEHLTKRLEGDAAWRHKD